MNQLSGKRAIVTGAARGIGRASALALARAGADVAITDLNLRSFEEFPEERSALTADSVVEEIARLGVRSIGIELDGTDEQGTRTAFGELAAAWGGIDILVNNAGGAVLPDSAHAKPSIAPLQTLEASIRRNLFTTVIGCQAALPYMASGSVIVNVSSQAASKWENLPYAFYGAAKAGIAVYTKYLAEELGPRGIRVNAVAPGFIATGRLLPRFREYGNDELERKVALGRTGTPEECADVVVFLASAASSYVVGQVLPITGGPYVS